MLWRFILFGIAATIIVPLIIPLTKILLIGIGIGLVIALIYYLLKNISFVIFVCLAIFI